MTINISANSCHTNIYTILQVHAWTSQERLPERLDREVEKDFVDYVAKCNFFVNSCFVVVYFNTPIVTYRVCIFFFSMYLLFCLYRIYC